MAVNKSPFIKCYHPQIIVNKYTKEKLLVPCGHCHACLLSKSKHRSMLCDIEEQQHRYCYFVTLSYSNEFLPLMQVYQNDGFPLYLRDVCSRNKGAVKFDETEYFQMNYAKLRMLLNKIQCHYRGMRTFCSRHNLIGYANRRDLVLFFKRLRKYIFYRSHENFRFYAVSEYGPKTFRPHFHILLYFDDPKTLQIMPQALRQSWTFGRVDASLSRGKCSGYVSSYVNSFVSLPEVFKMRSARPFVSHSKFFGSEFYKSQREKIYSLTPDEFIKQGLCLRGNYVEVRPWRSLTSIFYPKCKGFADKSFNQLLYSYTLLRKCREVFGEKTISEYSRLIASYYVEGGIDELEYSVSHSSTDLFCSSPDYKLYNLLLYFRDDAVIKAVNFPEFNQITKEYDYDPSNVVSNYPVRIASELYCSQHFLNYCCEFIPERTMLSKIISFYSRVELLGLSDFYSSIEEFDFDDVSDQRFLYAVGNKFDVNAYSEVPKVKAMFSDIENELSKSIKHKELNDLNNIFID